MNSRPVWPTRESMKQRREHLEAIRATAKDCDDIQNTAELHFLCAHIVDDAVAALAILEAEEAAWDAATADAAEAVADALREWFSDSTMHEAAIATVLRALGCPEVEATSWERLP